MMVSPKAYILSFKKTKTSTSTAIKITSKIASHFPMQDPKVALIVLKINKLYKCYRYFTRCDAIKL